MTDAEKAYLKALSEEMGLRMKQAEASFARYSLAGMWAYPYNVTCPECSFTDDHAEWCGGGQSPTVRYPTAPPKCDCGSAPSDPTHYHWCKTREGER